MGKNTVGTKRRKSRKLQVVDEDRVDDASGEDSGDDMGGEEVVPHDSDYDVEDRVKHGKPTKNWADIPRGRRTFGDLKIGMRAVVEMTPLELPREKNMDRNVSDELGAGNVMKKTRNVNVLTGVRRPDRQMGKTTKKTTENATKTQKQVAKKTRISPEADVTLDDIDIDTMSDDIVSETTHVESDSDVLTAFLQATKGLMTSMDDGIEKCRADQDDGDCVSTFDLVS